MKRSNADFFKRYNSIIIATFSLVTIVSSGLFYLQFRSRYQNEVEQLQTKFLEEASSLDYLIQGGTNHVSLLQTAAESYLKTHLQSNNPSLVFSQLENLPGHEYYALEHIKPPLFKDLVANLSGQGSLETLTSDVKREIEMALSLNSLFQSSKKNIPNLAWVYYTSKHNFINIYPWVSTQEFKFDRNLYDQDFYRLGLSEPNPQRQLFWTHAYTDTAGKGLMVTAAAPVYEGDTFLGTVALDFTLDVLNDFIQHSKTQDIHQAHLFLLNQYNELLAHPTLIRSTDTEVKSADAVFPSSLQHQSQRFSQLPVDQIQAGDRYLIIRHPLKAAPWQLVLWVPKQELVFAALAGTDWLFLVLLPGLGLTLAMTNQLTRKEFITPAHKLVEHIENEFQGHVIGPHNVPKSWQFWFEKVSQIFDENRNLLKELETSNQTLEAKNHDLQTTEALLAESNRTLEIQVERRTSQLKQLVSQLEQEISDRKQTELQLQQSETELRHKAQELEETLKELQHTQLQMLQSEKMSGLGQLVAGVAHEINNPVNFIHGNLIHVQNYAHNLLNFIQLYQKYYPNSSAEIQDEADEIDLEFLRADLPKILNSMSLGTDRIRQIVLSLRNFSRMDEAEFKEVDIHEGIDSTLLILQHRLKAKPDRPEIEVIRDYSQLPAVECYAGQLNQVFMNILVNAIDAIDDMNAKRSYPEIKAHPSKITIRTSAVETRWVEIAIADNGPGIPDAIKQRIFDPFFTTKPIGKGTGMGMSISYQIITEKHSGQLKCFSSLGTGTEFIIQIPIRQQIKAA